MSFARRTKSSQAKPSRPAHQAASQWVSVLCHKCLVLLLILLLLMSFVSLILRFFCNHFVVAFVIHWENPYILLNNFIYNQIVLSSIQFYIYVRALSTHASGLIYTAAHTYVHVCEALYGIIKFGFFRFAPSVCSNNQHTPALSHSKPLPPHAPTTVAMRFFHNSISVILVFLFFFSFCFFFNLSHYIYHWHILNDSIHVRAPQIIWKTYSANKIYALLISVYR